MSQRKASEIPKASEIYYFVILYMYPYVLYDIIIDPPVEGEMRDTNNMCSGYFIVNLTYGNIISYLLSLTLKLCTLIYYITNYNININT